MSISKYGKITDEMRGLAEGFLSKFGENYLGSREERDELTFWVMPEAWTSAAEFLVEQGFRNLSDLTAADYLGRDPRFDLMAILLNQDERSYLRLKTVVALEQSVDSLVPVWPGASWFEREIFDLFGIQFDGHPDLRRILLPPDYTGHPLRKDFPVTGPASSAFR